MLKGTRQTNRHDGKVFTVRDAWLSLLAGQPLGFQAMCLFIKADWAEWVHTLGFPAWHSANNCCPVCFADKDSMVLLEGFSPLGMPKQSKTGEHYDAACTACEVRTILQPGDVPRVRARLEFERRQGQSRGRALQEDMPELGLCKGDILVPTSEFPDVASLSPEEAPRECLWWRQACETLTKFRNPLFHKRSGVTVRNLALDWLHVLSLGVFQVIVGHLLQRLLRKNAFRVRGTSTNLMELGLGALKSKLGDWYAVQQAAGKQYTHLENLTLGNLGTESDPGLSLPGSATNGVLHFCHELLLPQYGGVLEGERKNYTDGVAALVRIRQRIKDDERVFPPSAIQGFCDDVVIHLRALKALRIEERPKHHLLMEMGARLRTHGSPAMGACWKDESDNKLLKAMGGSAHAMVFHERVLSTWDLHNEGPKSLKRKSFATVDCLRPWPERVEKKRT